ncbi:hypothetical protein ACLB2K_016355 [Fragaria x ananassa]
MEKQVAIVGAGISGLLACKYMLSKGFRPIVFEASNGVGGVWTKTVETTKIQSPKSYYQFSDFPWPSSDHPNQNQVLDYIQSYARHFDLVKHIKFNTKVCGIEYEGPSEEEMQSWSLWGGTGEPFRSDGKWKVTIEDKQSLSTVVHVVDFVILCIERFSDVPNIPEFPANKGPEAFHFMENADMDYETAAKFVTGKQVTVVGYQKSAMDIAMECSNANGVENPCTVLYKTEHWNVPDYLPWGVPLAYIYFNRFAELLVHKPGEGFLLNLLATLLAPSEVTPLKTDLVILATGFRGDKKLKDIFVSRTFQDYIVGSQDAILPLYRECIHGRIPQLAVVGISESVSNLYSSEMRCRWLAELLAGTFKVPSIKEMEKNVKQWDEYAKQYAGEYYRKSCIGALHLWYNDQLCKDMGWNHKRKKGMLAGLFEPYGPMVYAPTAKTT